MNGFCSAVHESVPDESRQTEQSLLKSRSEAKPQGVADFCYWPIADIPICLADVRFRGQSGHRVNLRESIFRLLNGPVTPVSLRGAEISYVVMATRTGKTAETLRIG
jgi:hypothetical protein